MIGITYKGIWIQDIQGRWYCNPQGKGQFFYTLEAAKEFIDNILEPTI